MFCIIDLSSYNLQVHLWYVNTNKYSQSTKYLTGNHHRITIHTTKQTAIDRWNYVFGRMMIRERSLG